MQSNLSNVLEVQGARQLEICLASKNQSPILKALGTSTNTLRFMRACLRGSYLFGRHVVPSYMAHVFTSLTHHTPPDNRLGFALHKLLDLCVGELGTNNIYQRENECHSHFHDLYEAYQEAGGNTDEFLLFIGLAQSQDTLKAIEQCPGLWSQGASQFAYKLLSCLADPLTSFIVMPCNEMLATIIYPVAIKHLCPEKRFNKFRRFLEVHIELDGNDHGIAALEWLDLYLKWTLPTTQEVSMATQKILSLHE